MKVSQYNISTYLSDGKILLFNSFTTSMVVLEKKIFDTIFINKSFDNDIVSDLFQMGFLVDDSIDEYKEVTEIRKQLIENSSGLRVATILLTTACNARCYYCFEKGIKTYSMTKDVCDATIEFLSNNATDKQLRIGWFGGEPLLAYEQLKYINDGLKERGIKVISSVTTNGSLINKEIIDYASANDIQSFQITIDDVGEKYDKIKDYVNIKNAYSLIINNVKMLIESGIGVSIRINYKIDEFDYAKNIRETLVSEFGNHNNLLIYLAALTLHNQVTTQYQDQHPYLKMLQYSSHQGNNVRTWKNNNELLPGSELLSNYFLNPIGLACGMEKKDRIIINADGKLYKCHRLAGREQYACGDVYRGIDSFCQEYQRFTMFDIADEKCHSCPLLPVCHGGCKANSVLYPECDKCSITKQFTGDLIKAYYEDLMSSNK